MTVNVVINGSGSLLYLAKLLLNIINQLKEQKKIIQITNDFIEQD
jgi:DNA polymerase III sliding clamp (beta) subunit (PCNA family)